MPHSVKKNKLPQADETLQPQPDERRFKKIPVKYLLPNLVTLVALCSGVTAIRLGIEGRYQLAVAAVILSIVLDAVDGRLARYLKGTSRFGAELDSLADFVNFGVTPAILLYLWALNDIKTRGWIVALCLTIACALRLARFNVALDYDKPAWSNNFFTGVPAPAGAGLALAPMYLGFLDIIHDGHRYANAIAVYLLLVSFLMISRVPTFSGKGWRVSGEMVLPLIGMATLLIICLVAYPWETLSLGAALYLVMIPVGFFCYQRSKRKFSSEEKKV